MGWETRGGCRYFYVARKVAGRVVKDYIGRGEVAELAAAVFAGVARDRAREREAGRAERLADEGSARQLDDLAARSELVARAALLAAGYHRHKREWRKKSGDR